HASCRGSATSGGRAPPRWTSVGWPPDASTATSSADWAPGTGRRLASSPRRRARRWSTWSPTRTGSPRRIRTCCLTCSTCSAKPRPASSESHRWTSSYGEATRQTQPVQVLLLTGAPGAGKTSVLTALMGLFEADDAPYAAIEVESLALVHPWPNDDAAFAHFE